jgi:predicted dehydrogenase
MRAVLIGCGDHGGNVLIPACLAAGIRLTGLVDRDTSRARALGVQWGIPGISASVGELEPGLDADAAIIALPVSEQAGHAVWALGRGLDVFVEKPPALDPSGLAVVVDAARNAGRICHVGMNFRAAQGMQELAARLRSGRYGQVSLARVTQVARKPLAPFTPGRRWRPASSTPRASTPWTWRCCRFRPRWR